MRPRRDITRRHVLLCAGATAVLAAGGAAGFWRSGESPQSPPATPTPLPTATRTPRIPARPSPGPSPTPPPPPAGQARLAAPRSLSFDTMDVQRSGERAVLEVLGRTHSRLVSYADPAMAELAPDLADAWEQPDTTRLVLHLDAAARWQAGEGMDERPVVAADVAEHLMRARGLAESGDMPGIQRPWDYTSIERVEAVDDATVLVEAAGPAPDLLHVLAGQFALVQRPEAIPLLEADGDDIVPEHVSGSGPFRFRGFEGPDIDLRAAPGGHHHAGLERLRIAPPVTDPGPFIAGDVNDYIARDRRDAPRIREELGSEAVERSMFEDSPVISTLHVGSAPWDNAPLRIALSAALNRYELAERLFGGRAQPAGIVPPAMEAFAWDADGLSGFPGYAMDPADDRSLARERWEAAGGPGLGPLAIDVPAPFDPRYAASGVLPAMLREALGVEVTVRPESYVNISRKASEGAYGNGSAALWFGWGPPMANPEPGRWLHETFHSASTTATAAGFADPDVDALLEQLRVEFDVDARRGLVRQVEALLLDSASGGLVSWLLQRSEYFHRARLRGVPAPSPFGAWHLANAMRVTPSSA